MFGILYLSLSPFKPLDFTTGVVYPDSKLPKRDNFVLGNGNSRVLKAPYSKYTVYTVQPRIVTTDKDSAAISIASRSNGRRSGDSR